MSNGLFSHLRHFYYERGHIHWILREFCQRNQLLGSSTPRKYAKGCPNIQAWAIFGCPRPQGEMTVPEAFSAYLSSSAGIHCWSCPDRPPYTVDHSPRQLLPSADTRPRQSLKRKGWRLMLIPSSSFPFIPSSWYHSLFLFRRHKRGIESDRPSTLNFTTTLNLPTGTLSPSVRTSFECAAAETDRHCQLFG